MSELDKFKRRLIRSVARLMLHEKMADEELWDKMKKETGCDCQVLWERMRALTIKKLRRQLSTDDRVDKIASIARMSLTDWLLFDLVLVHEKIDLIGKDAFQENRKDKNALVNLFELVHMFEIEHLRGDALADAWTSATVHYNSLGYQCSPMLLQRRWFQLKEITREWFYAFWYKYRGNNKKISEAGETIPSPLLADIAKQYPHVITKPFTEWEKLIQQRLVIMPQEFENKMREHMPLKPSNDDEPEIILIEPEVETIDLSDTEKPPQRRHELSADTLPEPTVKVKTEPENIYHNKEFNICDDDSLDDLQNTPTEALLATAMEEASVTSDLDDYSDGNTDQFPEADDLEHSVPEYESEDVDTDEVLMPQISNVFGNVEINDETLSCIDSFSKHGSCETKVVTKIEANESVSSVINAPDNAAETTSKNMDVKTEAPDAVSLTDDDTPLIISTQESDIAIDVSSDDDTIRTNDNPTRRNTVNTTVECVALEGSDKDVSFEENCDIDNANQIDRVSQIEDMSNESIDMECVEDDIIRISNDAPAAEIQGLDTFGIVQMDLGFVSDGIEFVDDGIVLDADEGCYDEPASASKIQMEQKDINEDIPKFDLKLLMNPVIMVRKLDNVSILKDVKIDSNYQVSSMDVMDCIEAECVPFRTTIGDTKMIPQTNDETIAPDGQDGAHMKVDSESEESEDEISESQRVEQSSNLLQKPQTRSYNPIQLCRNPDFNTRLKRLNYGFFKSARNCQLLKCCLPMTIDVDKSFESKLIDGVLYLKKNEADAFVASSQGAASEHKIKSNILPLNMSVQSLIDCIARNSITTTKNTFEETTDSDEAPRERKKVNLPDITEVRRINQKLLTAEVTPIRVQNDFENVNNNQTIADIPLVSSPSPGTNSPDHHNKNCMDDEQTSTILSGDIKNELDVPTTNEDYSTESMTAVKLRNTIEEIDATEHEFRKSATKRQTSDVSIEPKEKDFRETTGPKTKARIPHRPSVPFVPLTWLQKPQTMVPHLDDTLLTMDSLVKMLNVLANGPSIDRLGSKKLRRINMKALRGNLTYDVINYKNTKTPETAQQPVVKANEDCKLKYKAGEETLCENPKRPKIRVNHAFNGQRYKNSKYCCWAREKYSKRHWKYDRVSKHPCPPKKCACCCIHYLICQDAEADSRDGTIVKSCESIESVATQTQEVGVSTTNPTITNDTEEQELQCEKLVNHEEVPFEATEKLDVVSSENIPKAGHIHIDTVRGKIRVTTGQNTNVMDVQGEITLNSSPQDTHLNQNEVEPIKAPAKKLVWVPIKQMTEAAVHNAKPVNKCIKRYMKKNPTVLEANVEASPQRHIVIDGSKATPQVPTLKPRLLSKPRKIITTTNIKRDERVEEKPIYLGKNKILLTTVKLPRIKTLTEQKDETLPKFPNGVKLTLQSNGEFVISVTPGTQLTPEEIASLPKLLCAVQKQLHMSTKQDKDDLVTISDDENSTTFKSLTPVKGDNLVAPQAITGNVVDGEGQTRLTNDKIFDMNTAGESKVDFEQVQQSLNAQISTSAMATSLKVQENAAGTNMQEELVNIVGDSPSLADSLPQMKTQPNTESDAVVNKDSKTEAVATSSKKTILSYLMEMSGITDEDTISTGQDRTLEAADHGQNAIPIGDAGTLVQGLDAIPIGDAGTLVQGPDAIPVGDAETLVQGPDATTTPSLIHELNPITYFSELKYAYETGGLFFKLDLDTNMMVPINVCIKKQRPPVATKFAPVAPKAVIDLTDIEDVCLKEKEPNVSKLDHLNRVLAKNISQSQLKKKNNVQPLKLFNSAQKSLLRQDALATGTRDQDRTIIAYRTQRKRKDRRKQKYVVEAPIELSDTDELKEDLQVFSEPLNPAEFISDSSDDEPLSKKAMRKRIYPVATTSEGLLERNDTLNKPTPVAGTTDATSHMDDETECRNRRLSMLSDHCYTESANEDCILGV